MRSNLTVTFEAFETDDGTGPLDMRIVIPKKKYQVVAEDESYYYVQPVDALSPHQEVPNLK